MSIPNGGLITETNRQYYAGAQQFIITSTAVGQTFTSTFNTDLVFGNSDPATGGYNLNNFKRLDLVGFDFFESSNSFRNQLGHLRVADHTGIKEKEFFKKVKDNNRTRLYDMKTNNIPPHNIPTYNHPVAKPHAIKNYKR